MGMMISLVGAGVLAMLLSAVLTRVGRRLALRLSVVDVPRPTRWHRKAP